MKKLYTALFLVISQALALHTVAQYCTPSYTGYGYWNGAQNVKNTPSSFFTHLKNVTISNLNVSLSAPFSNPSPNYYDLTAYTADLTQNETYDLSIFVGNGANPQTVGVWVDYNQNQKFESSELVYTKSDPANSGTHILNTSITIPSSAKTGSTRMRVGTLYGSKTPDPCNNNDANSSTLNWSQQFLDFSVNLLAPATQSFISCNAFQNNYDDVVQGSSKNLVIGFQVSTNTAGTLSPLTAGDFTMSTLGTTNPNDISNARLYYTGINPNFSNSTQVGSTVAAPNGTFTINAAQKLKAGTNYFWLVFDVSSTALLGNQIDARLNAVKIGANDRYPVTSNPFGFRKVGYCVSRGSQTNFVGVWNVSLNTLSNNTFYSYTNGYVDYTYLSTNLTRGSNYNLTVQVGNGVNPAYARTWIDYNRDGDFDDAGELVSDTFNFSNSQSSASYPSLTKSINIPSSARVGPTRMRVSTQAMPNKQDPCTNPIQIGEVEDYTVIIQEDGQPVGDFKSSIACLGSQTDFYDNSYTWGAYSINSWSWDFGDPSSGSNTSNQQNPSHTYATAGVYNVTLKVNTNMPGKEDSIVKTVYVEQPVADFAMDGIVYKTTIGFNDQTTGGIVTSWVWNFGDPQSGKFNIDYSPAPRHIFDSAGTYNIMLVVGTSGGCLDTIIKTVQILSEQTPVADFSAPTFNPYIQASLKLVDQSLYNPTSWKWTFSPAYVTFLNGTSDTSENPEISFDSLGTYDVYLDATNSAGTGSITKQFVVKNYTAPVANFTGDPDTVLVGQTVNFTDLSTNDPTSWAWNFGDTASGGNNTSSLQFPTHQYSSKGNYSVSLTATNPAGSNTATKSKYIVVNNDFKMCDNSANSTNGMSGNIYDSGGPNGNYNDGSNCGFLIKPNCSGKIVLTFSTFNMLSGDVLQVFEGVDETGKPLHPGNGFSGSSLPGTLISTAGAIYLKEITDANSNSNGFAASWTAFANSKPNARVLADTIAYINSPFTFKNGTTQGLANTYSWDLDLDGVYDAYGPQATTSFANTGKQTIRLKVENCAGVDSITFTVNVKTPTQVPVANFSVDRDTVLPVDMVTFTDKSTNGPTSWYWDIQPAGNFFFYSGDEYSPNPQVGFITSGNYTVCLTATNAVGSSQTLCKQNVVIVKEKAQLCLFPYTSDVAAGVMYDSGDLNGDYSNNENCGYVIQPCADAITLHFNSFNYAAGDYLTVYDGIDNTGIPLFNGSGYSGTTLPPDLTAYSGAMYVETNSGPSVTAPGFDAEWNSTPATFPVAGFTAPALAYTQGSITDFKNTSVGTRNVWAWDFDGDWITDATTKDATWSYANPGNYQVTLIATNCLGSDTFAFNITVQDPTSAPVAGFTASMTNPSLTDVVSFTDTSTNGPNTWNWTFTPNTVTFINGTSNISKNPQVTFADTGWYDVCLAVSNNLGSDQTCHNQSIYAIKYCTPNPTAAANVGISKVQLGSINKNSVMVGGYQDFTSTDQTKLERRSTATIYLEKSSVGLNQSWKVWIDFNQNGSFADAEDQVVSIASTSNAQESASFSIPRDALKGFTRMRVGVSAGNNSNGPCNNNFGEYEDYRIEIIDDITKPIITLLGSNPDTVELGYTFNDPGATAQDNCDGNITANMVVVSNVNTSATGIYQITYDVTDSSGNKADQVIRLVWVSPDATAPVITLTSGSTLIWPVKTPFTDPGFTANDNLDGNISANVKVTGSVDVNHPADFTLTYTVSDAAGNSGTITRLVQVRDTIAPVITLNGNSTMVMTVGMPFNDPGATATDNYDASISVVTTGSVNVNTPGTYTLDYNAVDSSGNVAQKVTRTVTILTGMNEIARNMGINAWPNPGNDWLSVSWTDASATVTELAVYDLSGRKVMRWDGEQTASRTIQVHTQTLPSGMYLVRLTTNLGTATIKWEVAR